MCQAKRTRDLRCVVLDINKERYKVQWRENALLPSLLGISAKLDQQLCTFRVPNCRCEVQWGEILQYFGAAKKVAQNK